MNDVVQAKCDLFTKNMEALTKPFFLESNLLMAVTAASYTHMNMDVDVPKIQESIKLLRKKQGIFSDFRSYNELAIASKISFKNDLEGYIDEIIDVYNKLQKGKIIGSSFRALAATVIADSGKAGQAEEIAARTDELMKAMNSKHPFLTSDEDISFAVLLAMTDKSVEAIIDEIEACYGILKPHFTLHNNAVQSLSEVLTINDYPVEEKCNKVFEMFEAFKEAGVKYGKDYQLASISALLYLDVDKKVLAEEIKEVAEILKNHKGFKMLDMSSESRLMFAAMIVADAYSKNEEGTDEVSTIESNVAIAIAQEVAMMVVMMSAMAVSAASHASS